MSDTDLERIAKRHAALFSVANPQLDEEGLGSLMQSCEKPWPDLRRLDRTGLSQLKEGIPRLTDEVINAAQKVQLWPEFRYLQHIHTYWSSVWDRYFYEEKERMPPFPLPQRELLPVAPTADQIMAAARQCPGLLARVNAALVAAICERMRADPRVQDEVLTRAAQFRAAVAVGWEHLGDDPNLLERVAAIVQEEDWLPREYLSVKKRLGQSRSMETLGALSSFSRSK